MMGNMNMKKNSYHPGSNKELRPITVKSIKQKYSMMPNMKFDQMKKSSEQKTRTRTDTETTKDLMNDLDLDNDLSLI